jgi:hypothetical protein
MQRQIINGVPYFVDKAMRLYTWETEREPQCIGTYNGESNTIQFTEGYIGQLGEGLARWRQGIQSRVRKGASSNSRRNGNGEASREEDSEDNE